MVFSKEIFKSLILSRQCILCGALAVSALSLCRFCQSMIIKVCVSKLNRERDEVCPNLKVHTLFDWNPGPDQAVSQLLYLAKETVNTHFWIKLSQIWLENAPVEKVKLCSPGKPAGRIIFVPIPSSTGRQHSTCFAQALSVRVGGEVKQMLQAPKNTKSTFETGKNSQKNKNLQDRKSVYFNRLEQFTFEEDDEARYILVDDIITTGYTAIAAQRALDGRPQEIWCLAHRTRLASDPQV